MSKFPNLQNTDIIALDLETHDPDISELGPGQHRPDTEILTVAIATEDKSWAFIYDDHAIAWLKDNTHLSVIGANAMYDLGYLAIKDDIIFSGNYYDIFITESLLDAGRWGYRHNLDSLAYKYLNEGKQNNELKDYVLRQRALYLEEKAKRKKEGKDFEDLYGWKGDDPRRHIKEIMKTPLGRKLVLKYNKDDARQTYAVWELQKPEVRKAELNVVDDLENNLLKPLLKLKMTGVRIDVNKLTETKEKVYQLSDALQKEINNLAGFKINIASNDQMVKACKKLDLSWELTAKGNPSFKSEYMEGSASPFFQKCAELRGLYKLQTTYLEGFEKFLVGDRVYTEFHPVKHWGRGTETGRFSATRPALQTIPKRGEGKKLIRGLFLPNENEMLNALDYDSAEFRGYAHFARGEGAEDLRNAYVENPAMDPHIWARDKAHLPKTEEGRALGKTMNFALIFGAGEARLAVTLGLPVPPPYDFQNYEEYLAQKDYHIKNFKASELYWAYHDGMPCLKKSSKEAQKVCQRRGYAKTILGRRRYLEGWKTKDAWSTTVQGSVAEIMKKAMLQSYEASIWDKVNVLLTVHDELVVSKPETKEGEEAILELKNIMETALKLRVPLRVGRKEGPNWGAMEEKEE